MKIKLLRTVAAGGLLAVTLTACATEPPVPSLWSPVQYYPMFAPPLSVQPSYAPPDVIDDPRAMQTQLPPPSIDNSGTSSWGHDLAVAGAGAGLGIAGTQLAKGIAGRATAAGTGAVTTGVARGAVGLAERGVMAEALEGIVGLIAEDWWLLAL